MERRLDRELARAKTVRGAVIVIATVSTSVTLITGVLMTFVDPDNFPTIGSGLWWAVQTVTTVGYGDHVPTSIGGRILAALVMLAGIGFITVITASITSAFVSRSRVEEATSDAQTADVLQQMSARLERIEATLTRRT